MLWLDDAARAGKLKLSQMNMGGMGLAMIKGLCATRMCPRWLS